VDAVEGRSGLRARSGWAGLAVVGGLSRHGDGRPRQDDHHPQAPAERIVVAGTPLYTEILIDLGALDRIVGVSESADNPKEVEKLPKVGPAFNPNTEIIISLKPDVVFGAIGAVRETLERAGLIVVSLGKVGTGAIDSVTEIFRTIRSVNLVIEGDTKRADTLIGRIAEEIVTIEGTIFHRPAAHPLDHPESLPPRSESRAREARLRDQGVAVGQLAHRSDDQDCCGFAASESVTSPPAPLTSP
jgi:hypothetical protein